MSAGSFCRSPSIGTITLPRRVVEAGGHRGRLAEVAAQPDHLETRVFLGDRRRALECPVGAAVVDQDRLERQAELPTRLHDLVVERRDVRLLVEERDDDRETDGWSLVRLGERGQRLLHSRRVSHRQRR